jgi:hypothetical protein
MPKKAQLTHERVEYKVFLFDELLKGSKLKFGIDFLKVLVERVKDPEELIGTNHQHFGKYLHFCCFLLRSY